MRRSSVLFLVLAVAAANLASAEDGYFLSDGVKIHYVVEGQGEPVLLIHGMAIDANLQWRLPLVMGNLAKNYKTIAMDCRGHGLSGKPHEADAYGAKMVADAVRLLDHLGIPQAHVMGYSMGAFITANMAVNHPRRVRSAILGGAGCIRDVDRDEMLEVELPRSLESGAGIKPLLKLLQPPGQQLPRDELLTATSNVLMAINDPRALAAVIRGFRGLAVSEAQLRQNATPCLCLIGTADPLKARTVDTVKDVMANLKVEVIDGGDHMSTFMKPRFLQAVRQFLGEHKLPAPGPAAAK